MGTSLWQLYGQHQGKISDKWTSYLSRYEDLFAPYRDEPRVVGLYRLFSITMKGTLTQEEYMFSIWTARHYGLRPVAHCSRGC
jgi:hypothetical protein